MAAELDTCIKPPTAEMDSTCFDQTMDQPEFAQDLETKRQEHFRNALENAKGKYGTGWGWFYNLAGSYLPPDPPPLQPARPAAAAGAGAGAGAGAEEAAAERAAKERALQELAVADYPGDVLAFELFWVPGSDAEVLEMTDVYMDWPELMRI